MLSVLFLERLIPTLQFGAAFSSLASPRHEWAMRVRSTLHRIQTGLLGGHNYGSFVYSFKIYWTMLDIKLAALV